MREEGQRSESRKWSGSGGDDARPKKRAMTARNKDKMKENREKPGKLKANMRRNKLISAGVANGQDKMIRRKEKDATDEDFYQYSAKKVFYGVPEPTRGPRPRPKPLQTAKKSSNVEEHGEIRQSGRVGNGDGEAEGRKLNPMDVEEGGSGELDVQMNGGQHSVDAGSPACIRERPLTSTKKRVCL
ncbi:hypothetical protein BDZ89DRAFT_1147499 [Hymenopellis radicata]|nr:hypothetical protein BDZ89DRAFT_1147499 [Hymenopellis radicata]